MNYLDKIKSAQENLYKKYIDDSGHKNICHQFKFLRNVDTISFNKKMNGLKLTHFFSDKKYDLTPVLKNDLKNIITRETNMTIGIEGATGSGKSEAGMKIAWETKRLVEEIKGKIPEFYICFTMKDLYMVLKKLNRFDCVLKDESPRSIGTGSRTEKWSVDNVLHIVRFLQNVFVFIDPTDIKMSYCDVFLESAGMDLKNRINRFLLLNRNREYLGIVYISLHEDKDLRTNYRKEKERFVKETLEQGGSISAIDVAEANKSERKNTEEFLNQNYKSRNKKRNIKWYLMVEYDNWDIKSIQEATGEDYFTIYQAIDTVRKFLDGEEFLNDEAI